MKGLASPKRQKNLVMAGSGDPIPENLRFKGKKYERQSPVINGKGQFNAGNKQELMQAISHLMKAYESGDVVDEHKVTAKQVAEDRKELLIEALADEETWKAVGDVITEGIDEALGKDGYTRAFYKFKELSQGDIARVEFKHRNVMAYKTASASEIMPVIIRNHFEVLGEFYIQTKILVEERDIHQATGDKLEELYQEGLDSIMIQEDRIYREHAIRAAAVENKIDYFATLTPLILQRLKSKITNWPLPVNACIIASDLWDDMVATSGFADWWSPIEQHQIVVNGHIGDILSMPIITDAFRTPETKVLNKGEIFINATPEFHGSFQQRGDLVSRPINPEQENKPFRGWYLYEIVAMMLVNARSISAGFRR